MWGELTPGEYKGPFCDILEESLRTSFLYLQHRILVLYNVCYIFTVLCVYDLINNPSHIKWGECSNANRYAKSQVFGMQINTTVRYDFTLIKMTKIKKTDNSKSWQRYGEIGALTYHRWECTMVQPLGQTIWQSFKLLKIELPYDPTVPLLGI